MKQMLKKWNILKEQYRTPIFYIITTVATMVLYYLFFLDVGLSEFLMSPANIMNFRNAIIMALLFCVLHAIFSKASVVSLAKTVSLPQKVLLAIFTAYLTLTLLIGNRIEAKDNVFASSWPARISLLFLFVIFLLVTWQFIKVIICHIQNVKLCNDEPRETNARKLFIIVALVLFSLSILEVVVYNPGIMSWDSKMQMRQVVGIGQYVNHHPILHTLLVKFFYEIGMFFTGDIYVGVLVYSIFQSLFSAFCLSYAVTWLYKKGLPLKGAIILAALYAISPLYRIYSITMWKDVMFGLVILLYVITLLDLGLLGFSVKRAVVFSILSTVAGLLRNNAPYVVFAMVIVIFFIFKKNRLKMIIASVIPVIIILIITGPIFKVFNIHKSDAIESLSIPLQQIARVVVQDGQLREDEIVYIQQFAPLDEIKEEYTDYISDPIKKLFREKVELITQNKLQFLKIWLGIVARNPGIALDAFFHQTYGYVYPMVNYWAVYTNTGEVNFSDIGLDFPRNSVLQQTSVKVIDGMRSVPLLNLVWGIGFHFLLILFGLMFAILRNKKELLPAYIAIVLLAGTLWIAAPVFAETRYAYAYFTCSGVLLLMPFLNNKSNTNIMVTSIADMRI